MEIVRTELIEEDLMIHSRYGVDLNDHALELAKKNIPNGKFYKESITKLPFEDSSVDFVFTHKLLNHLDDDTLDNGVSEMFRVAKYIVNCELFGGSEEMINDEMKFRNMQKMVELQSQNCK